MIPGGGSVDVPAPQPAALVPLAAKLDALTDRAAAVEQTLTAHLAGQLATHQQAADRIAATLQGAVGSKQQQLIDRQGKIVGKLQKAANQQLGNAYVQAFQYGITYPTTDQAYYGLSTGNVLPSMGLSPATEQGALPTPFAGNTVGLPVPLVPGGPLGSVTLPAAPPPAAQPALVPVIPVGASVPVVPSVQVPYAAKPPGAVVPPPVVTPGVAGLPPAVPTGGTPGYVPPTGSGPVLYPSITKSVVAEMADACPPGQTFDPSAGGVTGIDTTVNSDQWVAHTEPPDVILGWTVGYDPRPIGFPTDPPLYPPWLDDITDLGSGTTQQVCIDSVHFVPGRRGQIRLWIPATAVLVENPSNGQVAYTFRGIPTDWQLAPTVPCDPSKVDVLRPPAGWQQNVPPAPTATGACLPQPATPAFCPNPTPPTCPAPPLPVPPKFTTADAALCDLIDAYIASIKTADLKLADWLAMGTSAAGGGTISSQISKALMGTPDPILPAIVGRFAHWLEGIVRQLSGSLACDPVAMVPVVIYRALARFVNKYTDAIPEQLLTVVDQISNTVCQSLLPGVGEADAAWLADQITDEVWTCWVKAAGHHVGEAKTVRDARRTRPTFHQAQSLFRRGAITQERFDKLVRQNGVTADDDKQDLYQWSNVWPSFGESVRWAGEQLFDDGTITRFELDDGFDALWATRFRKFVEGHGGDGELARFHWMAHWKRPGVNELIEMVRRLRPDKVQPNEAFTQDDLDAALKQEGFNDFWARRVKALAYRVAQRRDVQRLYDYHQIDEAGMKELLQDQGYKDDFADQLVASWQVQRKVSEARYNGAPMGGKLVGDYAQGYLSKAELSDQAQAISYYDGQADEIVANATNARDRNERKLAVSGLKGLFLKGLIGLEDARTQLGAKGMDPDAVQEITEYWVRIKSSKPKQVPAATLCQWRKDGLINAVEQLGALVRLGYSGGDAENIVKDCTLKIQQANAKAEDKALKAAQKAAEASAKSAAKAAQNATRRVRVLTPGGKPASGSGAGGPLPGS